MTVNENTDIQGSASVSRNANIGGDASVNGNVTVGHDLIVMGRLETPNIRGVLKGLFRTEDKLKAKYTKPMLGWCALVGRTLPAHLYIADNGVWVPQYDESGDPVLSGQLNLDLQSMADDLEYAQKKLPVAMQVSRTDDTGATFSLKLADGTVLSDTLGIATYNGPGNDDGLAGLMSPWQVKILYESWDKSKSAYTKCTDLDTSLSDAWEMITDLQDDMITEQQNRSAGDAASQSYTDYSCQTLDAKIDTVQALLEADINSTNTSLENAWEMITDLQDDMITERQERSAGDAASQSYTDYSCQTLDHKIDTVQGLLETDIEKKQPALQDTPDIEIKHSMINGPALLNLSDAPPPDMPTVELVRNAAYLTDRAKRYAFDDQFLEVGSYGGQSYCSIDYSHYDEDGKHTPYKMNEVWMTYTEAVASVRWSLIANSSTMIGASCRSLIVPKPFYEKNSYRFRGCKAEFIRILYQTTSHLAFSGDCAAMFWQCSNLKEVAPWFNLSNATNILTMFDNCPELETVPIRGIKENIRFTTSPKLSAYSVRYMVEYSAATASKPVVITLHSITYNKIIAAASDEVDEETASKLSEWSGLLELAASKNVTFACA